MIAPLPTRPTGDPRDALRARARELGFDACRVASAEDGWRNGDWLAEFVAEGRHGDMGWMETTLERRAHPTAMWPDARSAIVVGMNYGPEADPRGLQARPDRAALSCYAQGDDYHELIKGRLKDLAGIVARETDAEVKVFVDTAPLMEKPLAERAGIGWQGKHTNLVSREHGSWLFLGVILSAAALEPDAPETDHCGSCRACLDACPTDGRRLSGLRWAIGSMAATTVWRPVPGTNSPRPRRRCGSRPARS